MKYQLTCPNCKHEFAYDNTYYDKNIARLGVEIHDITLQIQQHKLLPWPEQKARTDWWLRAKKSLTEKQKELAELKAIRKCADQQIKSFVQDAFNHYVREEIGEEAYIRLKEKAKADCEAYQISGLMRHEYSKANYKPDVISISKL